MHFLPPHEDSDDDEELSEYKLGSSKLRRILNTSLGDTVVFDPRRYYAPMHIADLLKKFKANDATEPGNGRASGLSVPSSSSTRRSFVISSPVPSGGPSRGGTGRSTRLRFPIEVIVLF